MNKKLHGDLDWHADRHVNGERSPQEQANGKTIRDYLEGRER